MTRLALRRWVALGSCILFVLTNRAQIAPAAPVHHWQYAPYRVAVLVAVDGTGQLQGTLEAELTRYIERRIDACIGAVWEYDLQLATGSLRYAMATAIEAIERGDLPERLQPFEKVILVSVTARDGEYRIASREFD